MSRAHKLEAELLSLGRPRPSFASFGAVSRSIALAREWDAAHPELAARHQALAAELEREIALVDQREAEARRVERVLRQSAQRLERSGVGHRALEAAAAPEETEALGAVRRWLADPQKTWLVLCGTRGTGKSVAATWAVREVCRSGGDAAFRRAGELAKLSGFEAGARELEHLKRVALLVIDDAGTEAATDWARAQLHELADHRHEHYARTIFTSNLRWHPTREDAQGLAARLGDRIADRIAQAGTVVQLGARPSMRRTS
jgi:DNA replication protein DnaC